MLKDKTILYIVHNYNSFQKDSIEKMAKYFRKSYVLVRYKPISKIAKYLPLKWLKKYDDKYVIDLSHKPENVEVIKTPVLYLPYGVFYILAGYLHCNAVMKAIKKYGLHFDLVHAHFTWTGGYVGMKLKEKFNKPFIITGHGFDVYQLPFSSRNWKNRIYKILIKSDKIITVSRKNKDIIKELGVGSSKINVIMNGFNAEDFYPVDKAKCRKELNMNKHNPILISVGNLEKVKGQKYLIDAIGLLKEKYPNIICYFIGDGSQRKFMNEQIERLNLKKNIFLLGHMQHKEINKWMNAADLFVLPSISESFGIVQVEALACGKPVIATKNYGSKEIIISEDYGYLCNIADPKDLAKYIENGIKKKWNDSKMIEYSKKFDLQVINVELLKLYRNVLNEKNL